MRYEMRAIWVFGKEISLSFTEHPVMEYWTGVYGFADWDGIVHKVAVF